MPERIILRGIPIADITRDEAADRIAGWVDERARAYVACASVHLVETAAARPHVRLALEAADLVLADGAPVSWAGSMIAHRRIPRVTGSDLFDAVLSGADGLRHFFYGTTPEVLGRLVARLSERHPKASVAGTYAPPFRELTMAEEEEIATVINAAAPDVVWVGLGAPKQELWMERMRDRLDAPVLVGVGAVFDFVSGSKRRAPLWMRSCGLEWLFRLSSEPERLLTRYARTNTSFIVGVARSIMQSR